MEYVFGTENEMEVLKTKGSAHTDLTGYQQTVQKFPGEEITDNFRVVRKIRSTEDEAGNCYDWYEIDRHHRTVDRTAPLAAALDATKTEIEDAMCEQDTVMTERLADICIRQAEIIKAQAYILEQFGAQVKEEEALAAQNRLRELGCWED